MELRKERFELPLRLAAAAITVAGLGLLHSLSASDPFATRAATMLALVFAVCSSFTLIARGLGQGVAIGLGIVIAISLSIALANVTEAGGAATGAFTLVAITIMVLVGRIAGAPRRTARPRPTATPGFQPDGTGGVWQPGGTPAAPSVEQMLGGLVADFCVWTDTDMARQAAEGAPPWHAFARFIRRTLRERLGARDVRIYHVADGGQRLDPLAPRREQQAQRPPSPHGALGYALLTGHVYVGESHRPAGATSPWAWVLPLRDGSGTCGVVTVGLLERPEVNRPSVAHAVRDLLQLCWAHVRGLQALHQARRLDAPTGLLTRGELLAELDGACRRGPHAHEPVAVLALALEGLRRLDDGGQWSERDELVRTLGMSLRQRTHSDDLLARFTDERFIVVMRRADATLGAALGRELLDDLLQDVIERNDPFDTLRVRLRGALVAGRPHHEQPDGLVARALRLLDTARVQQAEFLAEAAAAPAMALSAPSAPTADDTGATPNAGR
jgi:GGDEF domain-containing protein